MKNKGFTLIEMMGVVIIIGIIAIISFNTFTGNLKEFREDYYNNIIRTLNESGKEFFNDNRRFRPNSIFSAQKVSLDVLLSKKYVSEVDDYNGKECRRDSYVIMIKDGKDDYTYHTCLKCDEDNYDNTNDALCDTSWFDPSTISYGLGQLPTIYIYKGTSRSELKKLLEIPISIIKKDSNGNILKEISGIGIDDVPTVLPKDIDVVNPNKVGTYEVHYEYYNEMQETEEKEEGIAKVIVYEHNAPIVKIDYKNIVANNLDGETSTITGTYTSGKWVQEITITLSAPRDGSGNVIEIPEPEVKIAKYQWNKNGKWQDLCQVTSGSMNKDAVCVITYNSEMNQDGISFRIIDTNGKISNITNPISIRIDNTKPTCTLKRDKENPDGINGWYVTPVTVSFNKNEDLPSINTTIGSGNAVSGIRTSNIVNMSLPATSRVLDRNSSNDNILHNVDTSGVEYRGYVEDQAGNFYICNTNFKKDETVPSCSIAFSGTIGENSWYTSNVGVSFSSNDDNLSGVLKYGIGSLDGSKTTNHTRDTAGITYTGHIMDKAGNTATCSNSFKKDGTKPNCTLNISGTTGNNGWYRSNVSVSFASTSDNLSGVSKYGIGSFDGNRNVTHTADTSSVTYKGYIKDNAGNTSNCSIDFKKDGTNPTVSWTTNIPKDGDGSYHSNSGITVTGTCSDGTSGTSSRVTKNISSPSGGSTVSITCVDNAGNSKSYTSPSYKIKMYYNNNCGKCGCATFSECSHRDCGTFSCNCTESEYETCSDPYLSGYPSCGSNETIACGGSGDRDEMCCMCKRKSCGTCNHRCRTEACGCETCSSCWNY